MLKLIKISAVSLKHALILKGLFSKFLKKINGPAVILTLLKLYKPNLNLRKKVINELKNCVLKIYK